MKIGDIKVGQKIKIISPSSGKNYHWVGGMYNHIGKICTIRSIHADGHIYIEEHVCFWLATDFSPAETDWDE